jgi:hypothetical protein
MLVSSYTECIPQFTMITSLLCVLYHWLLTLPLETFKYYPQNFCNYQNKQLFLPCEFTSCTICFLTVKAVFSVRYELILRIIIQIQFRYLMPECAKCELVNCGPKDTGCGGTCEPGCDCSHLSRLEGNMLSNP